MIERFIEEYSQRGYDFAYHLCGNAEDAKELVQEAFVRLISKWEHYDSDQPLENWFLTIVRNLYFDGLKRYERRHSVSLDNPLGAEDGTSFADHLDGREMPLLERLERQEAAETVRRALAAIRAEHRAILTMFDIEGFSYEQIAAVIDCPLGTVRSRLSRARAAFKKELLEQGQEVIAS